MNPFYNENSLLCIKCIIRLLLFVEGPIEDLVDLPWDFLRVKGLNGWWRVCCLFGGLLLSTIPRSFIFEHGAVPLQPQMIPLIVKGDERRCNDGNYTGAFEMGTEESLGAGSRN